MSIILGILLALFVFFVVVMIHEFGHFITARMTGMRVLEFGMGIPPKIKKIFTDKKGTDFTLNALPIGGFVRIDGEDMKSPDAFNEGTFMSKKLPARLLVLVAGVVMNWILACAIFFGLFLYGVKPLTVLPIDIGQTHSYFLPSFEEAMQSGFVTHSGVTLTPLTGSLAERSGIQAGDIVTSVNGQEIKNIDQFIDIVSHAETANIELMRNGAPNTVSIAPENGKIGSYLGYENLSLDQNFTKKAGVAEAATLSVKETYYSSVMTFKLVKKTLGSLFFAKTSEERKEAQDQLSGPIGAGNAFVTMVDQKIPTTIILIFVALLSINLAVMNILPFPALDGGRVVFTILYSISKRLGIAREKYLTFE